MKYNDRSTGFAWKKPTPEASARFSADSNANTPAATAADPYVTIKLSWFADSSSSRGSRFGTLASFAGVQNRPTASTRKLAT